MSGLRSTHPCDCQLSEEETQLQRRAAATARRHIARQVHSQFFLKQSWSQKKLFWMPSLLRQLRALGAQLTSCTWGTRGGTPPCIRSRRRASWCVGVGDEDKDADRWQACSCGSYRTSDFGVTCTRLCRVLPPSSESCPPPVLTHATCYEAASERWICASMPICFFLARILHVKATSLLSPQYLTSDRQARRPGVA